MRIKNKKRLSSMLLMFVLAGCMMFECIRFITFQTVLNEDFQLNHQKETNYYEFLYKNLIQELIDITKAYELPDTLPQNYIRLKELEMMIQKQTVELVKLNRGERDTFPTPNIVYLPEEYVSRAVMYIESREPNHLLHDETVQQQFYDEISETFNEHLQVVDADEYYKSEKMARVREISKMMISKPFNVFVWGSILSCLTILILIWKKQITHIFYVCSGSFILAGSSLILLFVKFNRFTYSLAGVPTGVGKELLFEITITSMLKQLSLSGMVLFTLGFMMIMSILVINQRKILMNIYFESKKPD